MPAKVDILRGGFGSSHITLKVTPSDQTPIINDFYFYGVDLNDSDIKKNDSSSNKIAGSMTDGLNKTV